MPRYSEEFKEHAVRKMMPPDAKSVALVARETGVSVPTLHAWRNRARSAGRAVPADPSNPENWSGADKLAVVIETAALNEEELSEYCRRKGLYPEQVRDWREAAAAGNDPPGKRCSPGDLKAERGRARRLARELRRKERALAEAAALLVLKKKADTIWGDGGED